MTLNFRQIGLCLDKTESDLLHFTNTKKTSWQEEEDDEQLVCQHSSLQSAGSGCGPASLPLLLPVNSWLLCLHFCFII